MLRYIRHSLTAKIITLLLAVILSVSTVNIAIAWRTSSEILFADRAAAERSVVFLGGKSLEDYIDRIDALLLSPYLTSRFMVNLGQRSFDYYGTMQNENVLKSLLFSQPDLEYLYFFTSRNQTLYSLSKQTSAYSIFPEWKSQRWIVDALESDDGLAVQPPGAFANYRNIGTVAPDPVFMASRRIIDIETGEALAVLGLAVSFEKTKAILDNIARGTERVGILRDGKPIFLDVDDGLEETFREISAGLGDDPGTFIQSVRNVDQRTYLFSALTASHALKVIKAVPFLTIQSSARNALHVNLFFLIAIALILCAMVSAALFHILHPLRQLAVAMGQVGSGDWKALPERGTVFNRTDEIGTLGKGFYAMLVDLNRLIDEEYTAKIKMQEAQLRALESQMNPHFLFNTIQSIGALALRKGAREVYEMNIALADTLRYALQPASERSTLRDEIFNLERYVTIQKLRFQDRLSVSIAFVENLLDIPVSRLILQPITENSIVHNLEKSRNPLAIQITLEDAGSRVEIRIEDNGVGMSRGSLDTLRSSLVNGIEVLDDDSHIGLRNVSERLRIFYRGRVNLLVDSEEGYGMAIRIQIPKEL